MNRLSLMRKFARRQNLSPGLLACTICLGLGTCAPVNGHADQVLWQPIITTKETVEASNLIHTETKEALPCIPTQTESAGQQTPPLIQAFSTLSLDNSAVSVAWSPDGKYIATAEKLGSAIIKIWSFPDLKLLHVINKNSQLGGEQILFTNDSKFLITTTVTRYDGKNPDAFSIIDTASGKVIREVPGYSNPPAYPLANTSQKFLLSKDGKYMFAQFNGDPLHILTYETNEWSMVGDLKTITSSFAIGPQEDEIALAYSDESADSIQGRMNLLILGEADKITYLNSRIISRDDFDDRSLATQPEKCIVAFGAAAVHEKIIDPAPNQYPWTAIPNPSDAIKLLYLKTNRLINIPGAPTIGKISFEPTGDLLAYTNGRNQIGLIFLAGPRSEPEQQILLNPFNTELMDIEFSPDGKFIAAAGDDSVKIYEVEK